LIPLNNLDYLELKPQENGSISLDTI